MKGNINVEFHRPVFAWLAGFLEEELENTERHYMYVIENRPDDLNDIARVKAKIEHLQRALADLYNEDFEE